MLTNSNERHNQMEAEFWKGRTAFWENQARDLAVSCEQARSACRHWHQTALETLKSWSRRSLWLSLWLFLSILANIVLACWVFRLTTP